MKNSYGVAWLADLFESKAYAGSEPLQETEFGLTHMAMVKSPVILNISGAGAGTETCWPFARLRALPNFPATQEGLFTRAPSCGVVEDPAKEA